MTSYEQHSPRSAIAAAGSTCCQPEPRCGRKVLSSTVLATCRFAPRPSLASNGALDPRKLPRRGLWYIGLLWSIGCTGRAFWLSMYQLSTRLLSSEASRCTSRVANAIYRTEHTLARPSAPRCVSASYRRQTDGEMAVHAGWSASKKNFRSMG